VPARVEVGVLGRPQPVKQRRAPVAGVCGQEAGLRWPPVILNAAGQASADRARFGFPEAPADLLADVITEPGKLVRMRVTSGFPFWEDSTWEWELGDAARADTGTGVLFRHYGFGVELESRPCNTKPGPDALHSEMPGFIP
jgi:hypothetical protein